MSEPEELHLESLLLTDGELQAAREKVQELAYLKWQQAGSPSDRTLSDVFWKEAEREWILYYYVPDR